MPTSKKLKYYDLERELQKKITHSVYFFTREESFLKDKAFKSLKKNIVDEKLVDFNYYVFYGKEVEASRILEELDNPPVASPKKLIIVRDFHSMYSSQKEKIVEYTKNPYESNVLVLETGKIDMRKTIYKTLSKNARVYYFYHAYDQKQAANFIKAEVRKKNKKIAPSAVSSLIEYVGLDLLSINNELQKLFLYSKNKYEISLSDVQNCVVANKGFTIFELQEVLAMKNLEKSLRIMGNLIENGSSEVGIVIMITRFFKKIWKLVIEREIGNKPKNEIVKSVPYFNREKYWRIIVGLKLNDFPLIFKILLETDRKLKSMDLRKTNMELMVYRLCRYNEIRKI